MQRPIDVQVQALADAYRAALRAGDAQLDATDRRILAAVVFESASSTARWVSTRVPGGDAVKAPLESLSQDLAPSNLVGRGLDGAARTTGKLAMDTVRSLALGKGAPILVGGVIAWLAAIGVWASDITFEAGRLTGWVVAALLCGAFLAAVMKLAPAVMSSAASTTNNIVSWPGEVGSNALAVFRTETAAALKGIGLPVPSTPPVVVKLRRLAGLVVFVALSVLVVGLLVFMGGFLQGFQEARTPTLPPLQP